LEKEGNRGKSDNDCWDSAPCSGYVPFPKNAIPPTSGRVNWFGGMLK